jgi:DNA-3-methyladenine glycosylase I
VKPSAMTFAAITATPRPAARPVSVRASPLTMEGRSAVFTWRAYSVGPMAPALSKGSDGRPRCWWGASTPDYERYHDEEWGRPVRDERGLYERMVLEGFQSGLSWLTILRKRDNFRAAFANFDVETVAGFTERDVKRLLGDAGIVRHRGKIEAAIQNAKAAAELHAAGASLSELIWSFAPDGRRRAPRSLDDLPAVTPESTALSKELKKRGFRFVGPTTAYATMQACGVVNDHLRGCWVRAEVEALRSAGAR